MTKQQFLDKIGQATDKKVFDAWFDLHRLNIYISIKKDGHVVMPYHKIATRTKTLCSTANLEGLTELIKSYDRR